jgi:hypothetical protein
VGSYDPSSQDQGHIGQTVTNPPPLSSYPSQPPASGPHEQTPLAAGIYTDPPPVYQVTHSLEHGAAVIWYDPSAKASQLGPLTSFFSSPSLQDHLIIAPYRYPGPGGSLPTGTGMALVAWHNTMRCSELSLPVAFDFVARYKSPTVGGLDYRGEAPEAGAPI